MDAFTSLSRGGQGGLQLRATAANQGQGVLVLGGNQNREVAMATIPDAPKQEMPFYLLCLDEAQREPVRQRSAAAPALLTSLEDCPASPPPPPPLAQSQGEARCLHKRPFSNTERGRGGDPMAHAV